MKPDTVECLKCAGSVVLFIGAAFLLWLLTTAALAGELPDGLKEFEAEVSCNAQLCISPRDQFEAIAAANLKMRDALKEQAKQPPKCAPEVEPKKEPEPKKLPPGDGPKRGI